jgi:hypothetical protein
MDKLIFIAKRLDHATIRFANETEDQAKTRRNEAIRDAADALRASAEREKELREALEPFGSVASIFESDDADRTVSLGRWYSSPILPEPGDFAADIRYTVADFRRARAALEQKS